MNGLCYSDCSYLQGSCFSWGTNGPFFAMDVDQTIGHECKFPCQGRRDEIPVRYVARDLLGFALLHSRKHASKRMMAKIHRARLEYEAML